MIPEMPKDWWPDQIYVRGKHWVGDRVVDLAFVMPPHESELQFMWNANLEALRLALWQQIHSKETIDGASA